MTSAEAAEHAAVVLDFDGPMCSVFNNDYPAPDVAHQLRTALVGLDQASAKTPTDDDPFGVLVAAYRVSPTVGRAIEALLVNAEVRAVRTATETPGLRNLLDYLNVIDRPVGVASNNSPDAVSTWLQISGLAPLIGHVSGRHPDQIQLMKPHPHTLQATAAALDANTADCLFIGDSLSDAQAAHAIGMPFVAYANKPHKSEVFTHFGCASIVTTLDELLPTTATKSQIHQPRR